MRICPYGWWLFCHYEPGGLGEIGASEVFHGKRALGGWKVTVEGALELRKDQLLVFTNGVFMFSMRGMSGSDRGDLGDLLIVDE